MYAIPATEHSPLRTSEDLITDFKSGICLGLVLNDESVIFTTFYGKVNDEFD